MAGKRTRRRERRVSARADARLSMRLEAPPLDGETAQLVTESQNISASGVYCTSPHFLAPLSKVALTIVLPRVPGVRTSNQLIKCEGIVVRCDAIELRKPAKGFQLACMFSDLDPHRRQLLDEFVTWRNLQALRAAATRSGVRRVAPRKAARTATTLRAGRNGAAVTGRPRSTRSRRTIH